MNIDVVELQARSNGESEFGEKRMVNARRGSEDTGKPSRGGGRDRATSES